MSVSGHQKHRTSQSRSSSPSEPVLAARAAFRPGNQDRAGRTEPYLRPEFPSAAAGIAWRDDEPLLAQLQQPRPARRWLLPLAIFAAGTLAGLLGAWWLEPPDTPSRNEPPALGPAASASSSLPSRLTGGPPPRGITSSELPYDGALPPPRAAASGDASNTVSSSGAEASRSQKSTARSSNDAAGRDAAELKTEELVGKGKSKQTSTSTSTSKAEGISTEGHTKRAAPHAEDGGTTATTAAARTAKASRSASAASSASRASPSSRTTTSARGESADKEQIIERMRREAAEELKSKNNSVRKTRSSGNTSNDKLSATAIKTLETRRQLARCARADSLFAREKCKWRICNGRWGERGCPSYRNNSPNYF